MTETRKGWPCYECQEEANENNRADKDEDTFDGLTDCPSCATGLQQVDQDENNVWTGVCWTCQKLWHWTEEGYWEDKDKKPEDEDKPACPNCGGDADEREPEGPCWECKVANAERIAEGDR